MPLSIWGTRRGYWWFVKGEITTAGYYKTTNGWAAWNEDKLQTKECPPKCRQTTCQADARNDDRLRIKPTSAMTINYQPIYACNDANQGTVAYITIAYVPLASPMTLNFHHRDAEWNVRNDIKLQPSKCWKKCPQWHQATVWVNRYSWMMSLNGAQWP